jgi:hemerythrin
MFGTDLYLGHISQKKGALMYKFTSDCLTGIDEIDDEHRGLFQLINEIQKLVDKNQKCVEIDDNILAKNLLIKLKQYAVTHFAHEESYMEKIKDPELERQKREHAQFVEKINSYNNIDISDEEGRRITNELLEYLVRWLYHHILGSDIMIGNVQKRKETKSVFAFADKYRTGIEIIDKEHEKLFEIINKTNKIICSDLLHDKYDEITNILAELKNYTITHFHDEEEYMKKVGYDGLEAQQIAHQAFIDKLGNIDLDEVDDNQDEYLRDLINFLLSWLVNHIMKMDKQIPVV